MDLSELIKKILEELADAIENNKKTDQLLNEIIKSKSPYQIVNQYTKLITELTMNAINSNIDGLLPDDRFSQELADMLFLPILENDYELIINACKVAQIEINKQVGVNLKPQVAKYDKYYSYKVSNAACKYAEYDEAAKAYTESTMMSSNLKYVDDIIKENMRFHTESGLSPMVSRIYDGVGLQNRKVPCQWCIQRAGKNVPYLEAKARGMFERHEGCGCEIEYVSSDGTKTHQYKKGEWEKEKQRSDRISLSNMLEPGNNAQRRNYSIISNALNDAEVKKIMSEFEPIPSNKVVTLLREEYQKWIDTLSEFEKNSIRKYTKNIEMKNVDPLYLRVNRALRKQLILLPDEQRIIENVSNALHKVKLKERILLYRNTDKDYYKDYDIGSIIFENAFLSTSVTFKGALNKEYLTVLLAPEQTQGAYIELLSKYPRQREFLIDRNTIYRVVFKKGKVTILEVLAK